MNETILKSICEYLREADTKRTSKDNWLLHPKFNNAAGPGSIPWVAIVRPSAYVEMTNHDELITLEFRKWMNINPDVLCQIAKKQSRGEHSVFDKYSRSTLEFTCRCERCVAAYGYPYAMREVEEIESFDLVDPDSLPAVWKAIVTHRYQLLPPANSDTEAMMKRYATKPSWRVNVSF